MIVKNEAHILHRLAESLRGQIDCYVIGDTGSTDNTKDVITDSFGYVDGRVIDVPWDGFGPARQFVLEEARSWLIGENWYLLTMDADDTFCGRIDRDDLELFAPDVVEAEYKFDDLVYKTPRLIRASSSWRWEGRAHECLVGVTDPRRHTTSTFSVLHHADGGNRSGNLQRELQLLLEDWADDKHNPRTLFYLARTYDDMGEYGIAASIYSLRLEEEGWDEENFYALYRLGVCLLKTEDYESGCGALWRAWDMRPHRLEPLAALAEHYRLSEMWSLAWLATQAPTTRCIERTRDRLFVDTFAEFKLFYEASIAAWYVGKYDEGREICLRLALDAPRESYLSSIKANMAWYEKRRTSVGPEVQLN